MMQQACLPLPSKVRTHCDLEHSILDQPRTLRQRVSKSRCCVTEAPFSHPPHTSQSTGTNAHALLLPPPELSTPHSSNSSHSQKELAWEHRAFWPVPLPSDLLRQFLPASGECDRRLFASVAHTHQIITCIAVLPSTLLMPFCKAITKQLFTSSSNTQHFTGAVSLDFEASMSHPRLAALASLGLSGTTKLLVPSCALITMASAAVRAAAAPPTLSASATAADGQQSRLAVLTQGLFSNPHPIQSATFPQLTLACNLDPLTGKLCVSAHTPAFRKPRAALTCHVSTPNAPPSAHTSALATTASSPALAVLAEPARWAIQHRSLWESDDALFSQIALPPAGTEPDVASCCMAESDLALQGSLLSAFVVWSVHSQPGCEFRERLV